MKRPTLCPLTIGPLAGEPSVFGCRSPPGRDLDDRRPDDSSPPRRPTRQTHRRQRRCASAYGLPSRSSRAASSCHGHRFSTSPGPPYRNASPWLGGYFQFPVAYWLGSLDQLWQVRESALGVVVVLVPDVAEHRRAWIAAEQPRVPHVGAGRVVRRSSTSPPACDSVITFGYRYVQRECGMYPTHWPS